MAFLYCTPVTDNIDKFGCGLKRGGLQGFLYVANFGEVQEISSSTLDKEIDTITMRTNPATSAPYFWYTIAFKKNSAGMSNEGVFGNNKYVNQTLTLAVEGITKDSLSVLEQAMDGEVVVIAKDYLGVYHVLGRVAGLEMSAISYGTGTAADDMYGGTITFTSAEPEFSNVVKAGTSIDVWDGTTAVATIL